MSYQPSLSDISEGSSYSPSLNDLPIISQPKNVETFLGELPNISQQKPQIPVPTEEDIKKGSEAILPFVAPPIRSVPIISNLLSKIPGATSIGNALGRIGYGTALTTVPKAFTEEGRENLPETLQKNLSLNTALEAASYPLGRLWHGIAELFNPIQYSRNIAKQIKFEHDASEAVMQENYRPINQKYGDYNISVTPDKYLKNSGIKKDNLYADAQKYYDDFVNEPTYKNLLNLKSQIGRDWAKISPSNQVRDIQLFNRYKHTLDNKIKSFLSHDPNSLSQYELANKYAENVFYPYTSTPTLKRISKGKYDTIYPEKMAKSIEKATNRVVGQEYKHRIPENHELRNHLKRLKNRIAIGDISEMAIPSIAGMISGSMMHPSVGAYIGGTSGLGAGLGSKFLRSKFLQYPVVQSPTVQNAFKALEPFYYGGGRAFIGQQD